MYLYFITALDQGASYSKTLSIMSEGINFIVYKGNRDGSIKKDATSRDGLKGDDILLKLIHSGLYRTDSHYREGP